MNVHEYGTHLPFLVYACGVTEGAILELGSGSFSTPVLDSLTQHRSPARQLITVDEDPNWLGRYGAMRSMTHELYWVRDWEDLFQRLSGFQFDVVFVDCELPSQVRSYHIRKQACYRLRSQAKILLIHDTEFSWFTEDPEWKAFVKSFKYAVEDRSLSPWTLALSDEVDFSTIPKLEIKNGLQPVV
jgi:hypothetical protein